MNPKDANRVHRLAVMAMVCFGICIVTATVGLWAIAHAWAAMGALLISRAARLHGDILWSRIFLGLMVGQILAALFNMAAMVGAVP